MRKGKKLFIKIATPIILVVFIFCFIFYGPITYIRDMWITSALTTISYKWLATAIYPQSVIDSVIESNSCETLVGRSDPSLIDFSGTDKDKEIEIIDIKTPLYRGYLMKVYDPSKVRIVNCLYDEEGLKLPDVLAKHNAVAGINGSGFCDSTGHTKGGKASGLVMQDGQIIYSDRNEYTDIIGITNDGKLALGSYTVDEVLESDIRDAISFGPLLIVDGKPAEIRGNGGWGIAPRTAIGQTKDGVFLFLVIDGRQLSSIGGGMSHIQEIMLSHGAYNCANLDGGSSSIMMHDGDNVNFPCTSKTARYLPNAVIVTE